MGGKVYHQVTSSANPEGQDAGMFREEDRKVYFIPKDSISELLLYDFNLELGDTFHLDPYLILAPEIVYNVALGIDSIVTGDDIIRKRICFEQGGCWIEGVGPTYGSFTLPWHFISLSGDYYLYCFTNDSIDIFEKQFSIQVGDYEYEQVGCNGIISSDRDIYFNNNITVLPNPFTERIDVIAPENKSADKLKLYSLNSKIVASSIKSNTLILDEQIKPGLYILHIEIEGEVYYRKMLRL